MLDVWTTRSFAAPMRFEAWRHALNNSHLDWELEPPAEGPFNARMRQRVLDGVRIIDCHCDPCTGWRGRPQMRRNDDAYFGILFELSGREIVRQGDSETTLAPGDFLMWDSERAMEFRVVEPLHKLTLLIPKRRMRLLLADAERYAGMPISRSQGIGGLAAEALRRLARELPHLDGAEAETAIDPVLSVIAATLMKRQTTATASIAHQQSFRQFCRDIEAQLADPQLSPQSVADRRGVSVRYLHTVFAAHGTSFGSHLRGCRLKRIYRDLEYARASETITGIAFRHGFNDAAHFSRAFKDAFGLSPRDVFGTRRAKQS